MIIPQKTFKLKRFLPYRQKSFELKVLFLNIVTEIYMIRLCIGIIILDLISLYYQHINIYLILELGWLIEKYFSLLFVDLKNIECTTQKLWRCFHFNDV